MGILKFWILFYLLIYLAAIGNSQDRCQYNYTENDIKIYTCKNEGNPYNGVKAQFKVNCSMSEYAAFIMDVDNYPLWKYHTTEARLIKELSPTEIIFHMKVDSPWPIGNRDLVLKLKISQVSGCEKLIVNITSIPDKLPEEEGYIRVKKSDTKIILNRDPAGHLNADWEIDLDPGGDIPAWIANMFSTRGPVETFTKARQYLESKDSLPVHKSIKN